MSAESASDQRPVCRRCFVSGRVQGVFFRASTADRARALGVTGWARNLADGRVEVIACGGESAVRSLVAWLSEGPRGAHVENLDCATADDVRPPAGFAIR